ncbi:MAG TPA: hypothetical protein VFL83_01730 [Anaeromyxobacter sp.]|nr:hypothetical protein [Anaeromyxobacter sp.]
MATGEERDRVEAEPPGRPWAAGVGLLLLGLAVSAGANALAMQGGGGPIAGTLGAVGYALGLVVSGNGVHRVLWARSARGARWTRILLTALVTIPVFAAAAIVLSLVLTITHMRFG